MPTNEPSKKDMEQTTQSNQNQVMDKELMDLIYEVEEKRTAIFNRDLKNPPKI